jgi:peptidoglycan/xylan/chitin deacetylase (PgdA/CDA1 family)
VTGIGRPPVTDLPLLLTFDDGPDPVWTGRILDVMAWKGLHPHILTLDSAHQMGQIAHTHDLLVQLAGPGPVSWWRAPYGQSRPALDGYAQSLGLTALGWHADGSDWSAGITPAAVEALEESAAAGLDADPLVDHAVVPGTPDGVAVVLLHDGRGENHSTGSVDRWASAAVLVSLADRYPIADPATL